MSLARRLGGCFFLLLLACPPYLVYLYVAQIFPAMVFATQGSPFFPVFIGGTWLVLLPRVFLSLVKEAQRSQLGSMLGVKVVAVADVASLKEQHSVLVAPESELLAFRNETTSNTQRRHDNRDTFSRSSGSAGVRNDAIVCSRYEVLRLRLPVRVALADGHSEEKCMAVHHKFYFEGKEQLSVQVQQHQDGTTVISRTWAGLPWSFRLLSMIFSASVHLMLSWVPRIVVLLFFSSWVDPAFSDIYCHRKLLVSGERV